VIGLVAVSAAGRRAAAELVAAWGERAVRYYDGPAAAELPIAFSDCDSVVAFMPVGVAVRLLAPLLTGKASDAGVVAVDEARRFAVALLGGHGGGANELALRVADTLGCEPVITTGSDATGVPGLDQLIDPTGHRWPVTGAIAGAGRAILDGANVALIADTTWPLPALPANVRAGDAADVGESGFTLLITDRVTAPDTRTAVLYPPSLVVGVGASRGVSAQEVGDLIDRSLLDAGLAPQSVRWVATVDAKADEIGIRQAADERGWAVVTHSADALNAVKVPNPSALVERAVGTASVAEAAALIDGRSELVVTKVKSAMATVAVARHAPRGRLAIVGLGPGARDLLPPRAVAELRRASVVVGLDQYVDQIRDLLRPGTRVLVSGLGSEEQRAADAVAQARLGHAVALVGSGDAGIYAMASPALELADDDIDVVAVPGITAALASAALLGAPLGHDHAAISLSDLHTPWEAIESRVQAAADGDLVVTFYNPRSRGRDWQLGKALGILAGRRGADTPVGIVRNASRADETMQLTSLGAVDVDAVDMYSVVVVGCSSTIVRAGRMITPRGYRWQS
jgi:cobalt-precorrin 5A hydrolase/precorrin-3B C17-methyltransferase